ncbi:MAG: hypothetical protein KDA72_09070 [Planctomycetales bacterium]|nr:hypothetical protein [Planctomycetales bacterium]
MDRFELAGVDDTFMRENTSVSADTAIRKIVDSDKYDMICRGGTLVEFCAATLAQPPSWHDKCIRLKDCIWDASQASF